MANRNRKKYDRKRGSFKNGFEAKVFKELELAFGKVLYEPFTFHYKVDEVRKYTPDFYPKDSMIYIEGKGKFTGADRKKMLLVIDQHPDYEFRMYFVSGNKRLSKVSKTTYGDWCDKHGIKWTDLKKGIPKEWTETNKSKKSSKKVESTLMNSTKTSKNTGTIPLSGT